MLEPFYWSLNIGIVVKRIDSIAKLPGFEFQLQLQPWAIDINSLASVSSSVNWGCVKHLYHWVVIGTNWINISVNYWGKSLEQYLILSKCVSVFIIIVHMWKKFKAIKSPVKHETVKRKKYSLDQWPLVYAIITLIYAEATLRSWASPIGQGINSRERWRGEKQNGGKYEWKKEKVTWKVLNVSLSEGSIVKEEKKKIKKKWKGKKKDGLNCDIRLPRFIYSATSFTGGCVALGKWLHLTLRLFTFS